jgi:hypothetical protein
MGLNKRLRATRRDSELRIYYSEQTYTLIINDLLGATPHYLKRKWSYFIWSGKIKNTKKRHKL